MKARRRDILISCSIILLCLAIVVGVSYALFTDSVSVENHLQAGTLDIELYRTNLKYKVLDNTDGYFNEEEVTADVEFTDSTEENIFGFNTQEHKIAPGSYFEAELQLKNNGNVAFTYGVKLVVNAEDDHDLEDQLMVTIAQDRDGDGTIEAEEKTRAPLSNFTGDTPYAFGEMAANAKAQTFTVRVEFQNLDTDGSKNNAAQTETASFDLIVVATQKTDRP